MAIVSMFGEMVTIDDDRITCDDPEIEEVLRQRARVALPEGYFVNLEHNIVAMLEELGGVVVTPPVPPPTELGRVY